MRNQEAKKPRSREQRTISHRVWRRTIHDFSTSWLLGFLASWLLGISPAFADSAPGTSNVSASGTSAAIAFVTVSHLGEFEQQVLRNGQLLSHRRATDPFGIAIRGPFKGLPPVVEHPTATPGQPNNAASQISVVSQIPAAINVPTLEKAVQELAVGAVNVGGHEILIGSRSIREGDLLVLESGGRQFFVWVQTIGVGGVLFCDTDLKKHILRRFGSEPKDLPEESVWGISDIGNSLSKDAQQ